MNEAAIKHRLKELEQALAGGEHSQPGAKGVSIAESAKTEPSLEDVLDHLCLQMKYVLFDLEATRRENRYLRQLLDRRAGEERD